MKDVIQLLGNSGEEIPHNKLPSIRYAGEPTDHQVVSGDHCYRWQLIPMSNDDSDEIFVGFVNGKVANKYFWSISL